MDYNPSIKVGDDTLTYLEVFSEEILRIVSYDSEGSSQPKIMET